jgi:hypothetical protein
MSSRLRRSDRLNKSSRRSSVAASSHCKSSRKSARDVPVRRTRRELPKHHLEAPLRVLRRKLRHGAALQ